MIRALGPALQRRQQQSTLHPIAHTDMQKYPAKYSREMYWTADLISYAYKIPVCYNAVHVAKHSKSEYIQEKQWLDVVDCKYHRRWLCLGLWFSRKWKNRISFAIAEVKYRIPVRARAKWIRNSHQRAACDNTQNIFCASRNSSSVNTAISTISVAYTAFVFRVYNISLLFAWNFNCFLCGIYIQPNAEPKNTQWVEAIREKSIHSRMRSFAYSVCRVLLF